MKKFIIIFALSLSLAASAHAGQRSVGVDCTTADNDEVGMRLCTELRDAVTRSPRYVLLDNVREAQFGLHVVNIRYSEYLSVQAVTMTRLIYKYEFAPKMDVYGPSEIYLQSGGFITGGDQVKDQAATILSVLDKVVNAGQ